MIIINVGFCFLDSNIQIQLHLLYLLYICCKSSEKDFFLLERCGSTQEFKKPVVSREHMASCCLRRWPLIDKMPVPELNLHGLTEWRAVAHMYLIDNL